MEPTKYESTRGPVGRGVPRERLGADHRPDRPTANPTTIGWTDCGHNDWRPGVVLDPFGGSGTTGLVATRLGRDAILIDIDERNVALAQQRIGLFFGEVTYARQEGAA